MNAEKFKKVAIVKEFIN